MSELSTKAGTLSIQFFLSDDFVRKVVKKRPALENKGLRTRLENALSEEMQAEWSIMTVSVFLAQYTVQDLIRLPNVGKDAIDWLVDYFAAFELKLLRNQVPYASPTDVLKLLE